MLSQNNSILRLPSVIKKTGVSRSWIYQQMQNKNFPRTISIGERGVGWLESEIDEWIISRISKRNNEERANV